MVSPTPWLHLTSKIKGKRDKALYLVQTVIRQEADVLVVVGEFLLLPLEQQGEHLLHGLVPTKTISDGPSGDALPGVRPHGASSGLKGQDATT